MADAKLTALGAASALDGAELHYGSQGGVSVKITGAQIKTYALAAPSLTSAAILSWNSDTFIGRSAAATLRLGAADAAAPVAQTLSAQSVVAGTSNTAGVTLTISGSAGTGTGDGGRIQFNGANAGSSGSTQNALGRIFSMRYVNSTFALLYGSDDNSSLQLGNDVALTNGATGRSIDLRAGGGSGPVNIVGATAYLAWSTTNNNTGPDLRLYRDAAAVLNLRGGTTAQTLRVTGTYTDASNYEWLAITRAAITVETAGTGADNIDLTLTPAGTGNVVLPGGVLLKTAAALTNGAAASTATMTNAPAVGNPTKWIPINDNGTTRYIPAW